MTAITIVTLNMPQFRTMTQLRAIPHKIQAPRVEDRTGEATAQIQAVQVLSISKLRFHIERQLFRRAVEQVLRTRESRSRRSAFSYSVGGARAPVTLSERYKITASVFAIRT